MQKNAEKMKKQTHFGRIKSTGSLAGLCHRLGLRSWLRFSRSQFEMILFLNPLLKNFEIQPWRRTTLETTNIQKDWS